MSILTIRKLADKSSGERVVRYDPVTGEKKLVNPATPGEEHESWPLAGVDFEGEVPNEFSVSTDYVDRAVAEGWMERVNERAVVRPAGPKQSVLASSVTGTPHTFVHCDEIVVKTMSNGDCRYRVVLQPDKYVSQDGQLNPTAKVTSKQYDAGNTRVVHFYRVERVSEGG